MEWFDDQKFIKLIKGNLPKLFKRAELESMRGNKIGMEVGKVREQILVAILLKTFGEINIKDDFSSTDSSRDVKVFEDVLSIKTFSKNNYGGLKVFWASDNDSVNRAVLSYKPQNHFLISQIKWGTNNGGLYLIPISVQDEFFNELGVNNYLQINSGNNRGISLKVEVLKSMISHKDTKKIEVDWNVPEMKLNIYERWINEII